MTPALMSIHLTGKTTALIYKLRANAQAAAMLGDETPIRQLFVTRSRVLTQHIAQNYHGLQESSEIANKSREELAQIREQNDFNRKRELVEFDNEVDLRDDLPNRYSLLRDSHFPLFVSFDKLCSLLEADIQSLEAREPTQRSLVTFTDFKYTYWPKFNHTLTRRLDPGLVFSEILGVIKGLGENLSREGYVSGLSHKKSPLLLDARDRVYAIFEAYSKKARMLNQIDAADRTRAILASHPLPNIPRVDYIFVDEVQDQLMLDIHLLQSLCSNPDGAYWCGDTAQTISVGSSFRIKDLKAFVYQDMMSYHNSDGKYKPLTPFTTFELSVNFRSHGGIVQYAASLVELIYTLFPNSIDRMEPETARTPGPPPLLFISPNDNESTFVRYLLGSRSADDAPFGAHQAIIVRSESTAKSLTALLQKRCHLTSLVSGLEFDDLIIYNFFSESDASASNWNALLPLVGELRNGRVYYDKHTALPSTSPTLCSELKQLYVAVTRARHRCWLWDSGEVINLTKAFWLKFGLLEEASSPQKVAAFAVSSKDLQAWIQRGQDFFSSGLYALARSCFERAGLSKEAGIADAYHHMAEAKKSQDSRDHLKAATMLEGWAQRGGAENSNNVLWYHSATCFEAAREIPRASRAYRNGKLYDRAALVSFTHQNFDDALLTLLPYSDKMEVSTFENIRDVSRMHYLRTSNYDNLQKLFNNDLDACIEYARSAKFSTQLKDLLKKSRRFEDLANVHLAEGSPAEAVLCLLKSSTDFSSVSRIESITSEYLWLNFGLDSTVDSTLDPKIFLQASQLFEILASLKARLSGVTCFDLVLFKSSLGQATMSLDLLESRELQQPEAKHRLVLGYHHALQSNQWLHNSTCDIVRIVQHLNAWRIYADNIYSILDLSNPSRYAGVRLLLGCRPPTKKPRAGTFVHVTNNSLLYSSAPDHARIRVDKKMSRGENLIAVSDADWLIHYELFERLKTRLLTLHLELLGCSWLDSSSVPSLETCPEIPGAISQVIATEDKMHVVFKAAAALNSIRIYDTEQLAGRNNSSVRHAWITRLFDLANPPTGLIDNVPILCQSFSKDDSGRCFQTWVNEYIWSLKPGGKRPAQFLSMFIVGLSLSYELEKLYGPRYKLPAYPQALICYGCSAKPRSIAADLSTLFVHEDNSRVVKGINVLRQIVDTKVKLDISLLVHLIERITREAILAQRIATSSQLLNGLSGLIMPLSWVQNLLSYRKLGKATFEVGPLQDLVSCISGVIQTIEEGVPAYWKTSSTELWKHSVPSLSIRMYWCIALVAVNVDPSHPVLQTALGFLYQRGIDVGNRFECEALRYGDGIDSGIETITMAYDQQTCLSALVQTLQHEKLVLLVRNGELYCPAKERLVPSVTTFDTLLDLRQTMFGQTIAAADTLAEERDAPQDLTADDSNIPHEEQGSLVPNPDKPVDRLTRATQLMKILWRRRCKQGDLREPGALDQESECYQRLNPLISEHIFGTSKRDELLRRVLRGPGLLLILSLEALTDLLEDSLENIRDELKASDIDGNTIEALQKRQKALGQSRGYYETAENLRKELSPDSPPNIFKASTLVALKTRLTGNAKGLFTKIKSSNALEDIRGFDAAESLLFRGVNAIRRARAVNDDVATN
ncbi:hypothetical protein FRC12_003660 [Ceratobasidium sp. 428]|nr:hypothetical protein FRC12_003660 [Ceratobasidium sp. 428]